MDGGLLHNNPVQVALEESRRVASITQQMPDPDIMLSIGTGLPRQMSSNDSLGDVAKMSIRAAKPSWLHNLFTAVAYQIKLNIDAERRWSQAIQQNSRIKERMHRVNPDLGKEPPEMDNVNEVWPLRQAVVGWLQDFKPKQQINEISCILVASTFYFERDGRAALTSPSSIMLPGTIKCRLSDNRDAMRKIGIFLSDSRAPPAFIVENTPSTDKGHRIGVPVEAMVETGSFEEIQVSLKVPGEDTITSIMLDLPGISAKHRRFPISGFPRALTRCDFGPRQM
jgi:hypothetical protein